jgi:hypothetical protein
MDDYQLANYMLKMPFEKFERKYFVEHKKELNKVAFSPNIWRKLSIFVINRLGIIMNVGWTKPGE